jgi:uracil-DNA glycosylase
VKLTLAAQEAVDVVVEDAQRWRSVLADRLESLARAGVEQLPQARARPGGEQADTATASPALDPITEVKPMPKSSAWQPLGSGTLFDTDDVPAQEVSAAPTLEILRQEVAGCALCEELASTRTQTVFGVGNPQAQLCFLGEAPGADEDRLGEPFVGRAGQLLNKILTACKLRREDVYILNMIKCRPPGNRNPLPQELSNCRRYLERQLELIQPEYICCLGAVAAQSLLETTASIGRLRKIVHRYRDAKVVCTYHPAYLLRNPAAKKDTWEDMQLLMREMGIEL